MRKAASPKLQKLLIRHPAFAADSGQLTGKLLPIPVNVDHISNTMELKLTRLRKPGPAKLVKKIRSLNLKNKAKSNKKTRRGGKQAIYKQAVQ